MIGVNFMAIGCKLLKRQIGFFLAEKSTYNLFAFARTTLHLVDAGRVNWLVATQKGASRT
jgi:hypothetical protein